MVTQEGTKEGAGKQPCILVVDDSSVVRYTVASMIRSMGYDVVEASDGSEVLGLIEEHDPELVILDIHMPEKGGIETLAELRADPRHVQLPVVVLTASADPRTVRQVARLKASGYLMKNLRPKDMRERIGQVLGKRIAKTASTRRAAVARQPLQGRRVLLVDDNPLDRQLIGGLLNNWGCRVATADNGREALKLLGTSAGFDLVLMDAKMPEMDGFAAAAAIRRQEQETGAHLPIALLTSKPIETVQERSQEVGIDAFVAKPVAADQLFTTIEGMAALVVQEATPGAGGPPFDREELMERVDNDVELLRHVLQLFFRDYPGLVEEMRQAIAAGEAPKLQEPAHTLKGMLGNLSAHAAVRTTLQLETLGREWKPEQAPKILERLEGELELLTAALREVS